MTLHCPLASLSDRSMEVDLFQEGSGCVHVMINHSEAVATFSAAQWCAPHLFHQYSRNGVLFQALPVKEQHTGPQFMTTI